MPIHQLAQFCADTYNRNDRCGECPNSQCLCNDGTCEKCLGNAHYFDECDRSYSSCTNITRYYTGKFIYRYSSEIEYALNSCRDFFEANSECINVCSIGCGPSTELFGLDSFLRKNGINKQVTYTGFDYIDTWTPIHERIKEIFPDYHISYYQTNCFEFYKQEENNQRPNLVILNYMLSDLLTKQKEDVATKFIDDFCAFFTTLPSPSLLVLNDLNLDIEDAPVRKAFSLIREKLAQTNTIVKTKALHFPKASGNYWRYGLPHPSSTPTSTPNDDMRRRFQSNMECASAQFLLLK